MRVAAVLLTVLLLRPIPVDSANALATGLLIVFVGLAAILRPSAIHPQVLHFLRAWAAVGIAWTVLGLAAGSPGVLEVAAVWVVVPLVARAVSLAWNSKSTASLLPFLLTVSLVCSGSVLAFAVGRTVGIELPLISALELSNSTFVVREGIAGVRFSTLQSLPLLVPIPFAALAWGGLGRSNLTLAICSAVSCLAAALVSGRRGALIGLVAVPLVLFLVKRSEGRKLNLGRTGLVIVAAAAVTLGAVTAAGWVGISATATLETIIQVPPDDPRPAQAKALLASLLRSPIWGHGFGADLTYQRGQTELTTYRFEVLPLAYLRSFGALGAIALWSGGRMLLKRSRDLLQKSNDKQSTVIVVLLCSSAGALIASATNPYLFLPVNWWPIVLLAAVCGVLSRSEISTTTNSRPLGSRVHQ